MFQSNNYQSNYHGIEYIVGRSYLAQSAIPVQPPVVPYYHHVAVPMQLYSSKSDTQNNIYYSRHSSYSFMPEIFLKEQRVPTRFINTSEEIQQLVEEAFTKLTGKQLPDISLKICSEAEMKVLHPKWNPGIIGFCMHHTNQVFVKNDSLDKVLITIGHEIGHVFTRHLDTKHNEEAKAFAFEFGWIRTIKEHNIGDIAQNIIPFLPAQNGLHDVAFNFVVKELKQGKQAMDLHWDLVKRYVMIDLPV